MADKYERYKYKKDVILDYFDISMPELKRICKKLGMTPLLYGRAIYFAEEHYQMLKKYFDDLEATERKSEKNNKYGFSEKELEKLKKEHPLITDYRCFILDWFPDVSIKERA